MTERLSEFEARLLALALADMYFSLPAGDPGRLRWRAQIAELRNRMEAAGIPPTDSDERLWRLVGL